MVTPIEITYMIAAAGPISTQKGPNTGTKKLSLRDDRHYFKITTSGRMKSTQFHHDDDSATEYLHYTAQAAQRDIRFWYRLVQLTFVSS